MKIFVYGTLKKGGLNHYLIEKCKFLGNATTVELYSMHPSICNNYPFVIESVKRDNISGEVYEVTERRTMKQLEILEGSPTLYYKKKIYVLNQLNEKIKVDMYIKNENYYPNIINKTKIIDNWDITIDNRSTLR